MDISVAIFQPENDGEVPPGRDESEPIKARAYYRRGDLISVNHLHSQPIALNRRIRVLHITGAPQRDPDLDIALEIIRTQLLSGVDQGTGENSETIRRRKWRFLIPELNAAQRSDLKNNGHITITWNYFKNRCRIKAILNPNDQSLDDLSTALKDSDI